MVSLATPKFNLSLKKRRYEGTSTPPPPLQPEDRCYPQALDKETNEYVNWCVNRSSTSRKVISEQKVKSEKLRQQLDSNEFPSWVRNKYKTLCEDALLSQCRFITSAAVESCEKKIAKAESIISAAEQDFDDLMKALQTEPKTDPCAESVKRAYSERLAHKIAGQTAKQLMADKKSAKKDQAEALPTQVDTSCPTSDEIGKLIKREVKAQLASNPQPKPKSKKARGSHKKTSKKQSSAKNGKGERTQPKNGKGKRTQPKGKGNASARRKTKNQN